MTAKTKLPNGNGRLPSGWKVAGGLVSFLTAVVFIWVGVLHSSISGNDRSIQLLQAQVASEKNKTDVTLEGLKGKVEQIQRDVGRIEQGQERIKDQTDKIKEQQDKANTNLERVLDELKARQRVK